MLVLTTDSLPDGYGIVENYGFVQTTHQIKVSQKGIIESITSRNRNEYQDALDNFQKSAPTGANVIYGVKASTAIGMFNNGTYLFLTYIGTAARCSAS